jgi:abequosyltransferase
MHPERPLLSIAIPTYNRSACLTQLLEILLPQVGNESQVELIVSDNASQDDTQAVVASFQKRGLALKYKRNELNIGADANFIQCFELARGEYVWIFGDDDVIVPGGLREVLRLLENRNLDLLYIHSRGFKGKYDGSAVPKFSRKLRVFTRPEDFALVAYTGLTFISGNVVRKAALERQAHKDFTKLIGTNLAQLSWTFSLLQGNPKCAFLSDDIVASRLDNSGGHGTCQVFGANLQALVKEFFGLQSPVGRAILNRTIQCWFPWSMFLSRRNQRSTHLPEDREAILKSLYRDNLRYWFFLHPILRLPLPLAAGWLFTVKVINRLDQAFGYPIAR